MPKIGVYEDEAYPFCFDCNNERVTDSDGNLIDREYYKEPCYDFYERIIEVTDEEFDDYVNTMQKFYYWQEKLRGRMNR